ncbi:transcriptional coactivator p15/PC4 family protein [bacterium]|nr:transcriptional coactivator p15/PC4 family protein [candidate division CSSED10-310 bacterium]
MANKNISVGSIPKKDGLEIRATLTEYRNEFYIDIREFMKSEDYEGPTKKGIRFHSENWDDFFKLIKKLDQEIKKRA